MPKEFKFSQSLWDNLESISRFHKNGQQKLTALEKFGRNIAHVINTFSESLKECTEDLCLDFSVAEESFDESSTTRLAFNCIT